MAGAREAAEGPACESLQTAQSRPKLLRDPGVLGATQGPMPPAVRDPCLRPDDGQRPWVRPTLSSQSPRLPIRKWAEAITRSKAPGRLALRSPRLCSKRISWSSVLFLDWRVALGARSGRPQGCWREQPASCRRGRRPHRRPQILLAAGLAPRPWLPPKAVLPLQREPRTRCPCPGPAESRGRPGVPGAGAPA